MEVKSENPAKYDVYVDNTFGIEKQEEILYMAKAILEKRFRTTKEFFKNPSQVKQFLTLKLAELEYEVFSVMFLDNRHRLIKYEQMFRGTIDGASVYQREIVKRALELNSAAIIISHNHPSGNPTPSFEDEILTNRIKEACNLLEIRLLDHIVVGKEGAVSLAEGGKV